MDGDFFSSLPGQVFLLPQLHPSQVFPSLLVPLDRVLHQVLHPQSTYLLVYGGRGGHHLGWFPVWSGVGLGVME